MSERAPAKKPAKRAPRKKAAETVPVVDGVTPLSQLSRGSGPSIPAPPLEEIDHDLDLEPVATFTAYGPRLSTGDNGEMTITMKADKQQKYHAMPITDHNDVTLFFKAFVVRRGG